MDKFEQFPPIEGNGGVNFGAFVVVALIIAAIIACV